ALSRSTPERAPAADGSARALHADAPPAGAWLPPSRSARTPSSWSRIGSPADTSSLPVVHLPAYADTERAVTSIYARARCRRFDARPVAARAAAAERRGDGDRRAHLEARG